jgi:hypothetical protein
LILVYRLTLEPLYMYCDSCTHKIHMDVQLHILFPLAYELNLKLSIKLVYSLTLEPFYYTVIRALKNTYECAIAYFFPLAHESHTKLSYQELSYL